MTNHAPGADQDGGKRDPISSSPTLGPTVAGRPLATGASGDITNAAPSPVEEQLTAQDQGSERQLQAIREQIAYWRQQIAAGQSWLAVERAREEIMKLRHQLVAREKRGAEMGSGEK